MCSCVQTDLSEVELEHIADVMRGGLRELHQLLAIFKGLAQLLHTRLHPIHTVDALHNRRTPTHTVSLL